MIPVSNVANTQAFGTWEQKFNQIATLMSSNVVTSDNSAGGSLTTGNVQVNGSVAVTNLSVASLLGGNNTANANLAIGTNTIISTGLTQLVAVLANSSTSSLNVSTNSVSFGASSIIVSALTSSNTLSVNGNIFSNTSVNVGANVLLNTTGLVVGNSTVNNSINSTVYSGTSNNATNLGGHPSSYYANVTNPSFSTALTVGANVALTTSALQIGNSTVNVSINSTVFTGTSWSANNATNLGGTAASGYQTTAGLSANVTTLSANYATTSGTANNATNLGGIPAANYALLTGASFATVNVGANVLLNTSSFAIGNSTQNVQINSTAIGSNGITFNFVNGMVNTVGNVALNGALLANGLIGLDGMVLTTSGDGSNVFWMGIQGNGTIGGTNATIQFANNGDFDGDANLTYSPTTHTMYIGNTTLTPGNVSLELNATTLFLGNSTQNLVMNSTIITTNNLTVSGNVNFKGLFPDSHRNRIINGQFRVNQYPSQNPVVFSNTSVNGYYIVDRYYLNYSGIVNTAVNFYIQPGPSIEQFANSLGFSCGTGGFTTFSYASNNIPTFSLRQNIEQYKLSGFNIGYANCVPMVLSFWVYTGSAGTYGGCLMANSFSYPFTYSVGAANTWTKATVNVAPLTTGGNTYFVVNSSATGMILSFEHAAFLNANNPALAPSGNVGVWSNNSVQYISPKTGLTSFFTTIASNQWIVTGIQLEAANYPTPFAYQDETQEIMDCFRYYQQRNNIDTESCYAPTTGAYMYSTVAYNGQMRASPTVNIAVFNYTGTNVLSSSILGGTNTAFAYRVTANGAGLTTWQINWTATAEL